METDDALFFIRVVTSGGFAKASRILEVPKSTLSRRISNLEEQLGVKLLERTTRSIALTDIGRGYFQHCEQIVENVQEANNFIAQAQSEPKGILRIAISPDMALLYMQDLFVDFMMEYPDISLTVDMNQRVVNIIDEGFDLAIRYGPLQDSNMIARKIGVTKMELYSRKDYFSGREIPKHPNQLNPEDCITLNSGIPFWIFKDGKKEIKVTPQSRYKINNFIMIQKAVLKGLGISLLPPSSCEPYLEKLLMPLLENYTPPEGTVFAVYPSNRFVSSKLRVFLDYLQEHL